MSRLSVNNFCTYCLNFRWNLSYQNYSTKIKVQYLAWSTHNNNNFIDIVLISFAQGAFQSYKRFPILSKVFLLGLPKGSPRLKMPFIIFSAFSHKLPHSLKCMRALLSLRMHMIREHAQTHMVKKRWIYIKRCPRKEA